AVGRPRPCPLRLRGPLVGRVPLAGRRPGGAFGDLAAGTAVDVVAGVGHVVPEPGGDEPLLHLAGGLAGVLLHATLGDEVVATEEILVRADGSALVGDQIVVAVRQPRVGAVAFVVPVPLLDLREIGRAHV